MKITLVKLDKWLDVITKIIVVIGLPFTLAQYVSTTQKENRDREYEAYNSLDKEFKDWQVLCLSYPELDIADTPDSISMVLDTKQQKQELILFTILLSLFERAFVLCNDGNSKVNKAQWAEWNDYILIYCERENFRKAWKVLGVTWDPEFQNYMNDNLRKAELN